MKDCLGNVQVITVPNVIIQYSANGSTGWSTSITGAKYIRFSTNNGTTFSAGVKFVGDDGSDGSDANNAIVLYNNLSQITVNPTGTLVLADTYNLPAGKLASNGDVIKITSCYTIPTGTREIVISDFIGNTNSGSEVAICEITGTVSVETKYIRIETSINRIDANNVFIETVILRSGNSGDIVDSPIFYTKAIDCSTSIPIYIGVTDTSAREGSTIVNMIRVEYLKK